MPRASKAAASPAWPRCAKSPPARWAWKCSKRFPVEILSAGKVPPKQRHHSGAGPGPEIVDPLPHCLPESLNVVPPPLCAPKPGRDPAPAKDGAAPAAVAAANAAAASFTALTSRLDYLDAA